MARDRISQTIEQQIALLDPFLLSQEGLLEELARQLAANFHKGGRLFLTGSGPFGTIASLLGQSFLHRQTIERPALPAIALTNDAGLATFLAADEKSSQIFSRQLRALATSEDTLMILAGTEIAAADLDVFETAQQMGCKTVLIASDQIRLTAGPADLSVQIPTDSLPRLLEGTLLIGNLLCSLIEGELFGI